jgi:O-acetyl-ADP-ribose deacetylase (regulator of RNase III)
MITVKRSNILVEETGVIVHSCNNRGVMGSGIAKQIKDMYPEVFVVYTREDSLDMGKIIPVQVSERKYIINLIGQDGYGRDGKRYMSYDAFYDGFRRINSFMHTLDHVPELKFPLIGAGLGGGNWDIIEKIIDVTIDKKFKKTLFVID